MCSDRITNMRQLDLSRDFHTLTTAEVEVVLALADEQHYHRPKNANGSRARYFWAKLQREQYRDKREGVSK